MVHGAQGAASDWMGWLGMSSGPRSRAPQSPPESLVSDQKGSSKEHQASSSDVGKLTPKDSKGRRKSEPTPDPAPGAPRSWLGLWSNSNPQQATKPISTIATSESMHTDPHSRPEESFDTTDETPAPAATTSASSEQPSKEGKTTGWAFWSRDHPAQNKAGDHVSSGKLAVAGAPSQSKLETTVLAESKAVSKSGEVTKSQPLESPPQNVKSLIGKPPATVIPTPDNPTSTVTPKSSITNLLLPAFDNTFPPVEKPGLWQQVLPFNLIEIT